MSDKTHLKLQPGLIGETIRVIDFETRAPVPFERIDADTIAIDSIYADRATVQIVPQPRKSLT